MKVWESRDLGEAKEYLGMRMTRDRKKRTLTLDQCVYAEKVLKRFGTQNAKPMLEETSNYPNRRGYRCQRVTTRKVSKNRGNLGLTFPIPIGDWIFAINYAWNLTGHCLCGYPHVTVLC